MTALTQDQDRNVVPRWRSFYDAQKLDELHSSTPRQATSPLNLNSLLRKQSDWEINQTVGHASDFVGAALISDKLPDAIDAINFLLNNSTNASPLAVKLAQHCKLSLQKEAVDLHPPLFDRTELENQIRESKRLLHREPHNPVKWVDQSRLYTILGQNNKASHCMDIAVALAPDNRFTLRSATRLWIHTDQPDKAHDILVKSNNTPHDPWLLAAEIVASIAAKTKTKFIKNTHSILSSDKFLDSHVSELASAAATLDWKNGYEKRSRKLFRKSMIKPTENSVAQAVWVSGEKNLLDLDEDSWKRPNTYEASAHHFYFNKKWNDALNQCKLWQFDEPFSSRPGILGSFLASTVLEDHEEALKIARISLDANPNNFLLLNNSAYALINLEKFKEAENMLSIPPPSKENTTENQVAKMATTGLLHYRTGEIHKGRQLYTNAQLLAESITKNNPSLAARVAGFHALEEFALQEPNSDKMIDDAIQNLKNHHDPACYTLLNKLEALPHS